MKKISTVLVVIKNRLVLREVVRILDDRGVETIIAESFEGIVFGLDKYRIDAIVMWPYIEFYVDETVKFLSTLPSRGFEGPVVAVDARPEDCEVLLYNGVKYRISGQKVHELITIFGIKTEKEEVADEAKGGFAD